MKSLIFDTDVLSTFGKIRKFGLNDIAAKKVCDQYGVQFIDLSMILKSLLAEKVLTNSEIRALIDEIELKDKVIIKDKEDIWTAP